VWQVLGEVFRSGERVLELGCGTGEDAVWLARRGVSVVATDQSAEMLKVAQEKARRAGVAERIEFAQVDAAQLAGVPSPAAARLDKTLPEGEVFDRALADFGVLNCVADRRRLGLALAERLRPGGTFVAVVMGPVCLWELAWYLVHGDLGRATRRWRSGGLALVGGERLPVWYPSPPRLRAELMPRFALRRVVGLGALLPPSYLSHLVERWPAVFQKLATLDDKVPGGAWLADHYVAVFERR
jgi:SAM-dependent methyltransferase